VCRLWVSLSVDIWIGLIEMARRRGIAHHIRHTGGQSVRGAGVIADAQTAPGGGLDACLQPVQQSSAGPEASVGLQRPDSASSRTNWPLVCVMAVVKQQSCGIRKYGARILIRPGSVTRL